MKQLFAAGFLMFVGLAHAGAPQDADHYLVLNDDGYYLPVAWKRAIGVYLVFSVHDPHSLPVNPFDPTIGNSIEDGLQVTSEAVASPFDEPQDGLRRLGAPTSAYSIWLRDGEAVYDESYDVVDTWAQSEGDAVFVIRQRTEVASEMTLDDEHGRLALGLVNALVAPDTSGE